MTEDSHATKGMGMAGEMGGGAARFARLPVSGRCPWGNFRRPLVLVGRYQPPTQTTVCCSRPLTEMRWGRARFASRTATGSALAPSRGHVSVTQRPLSVVTASHRPLTATLPAPRTCGGSAGALRRVAEPPLYLVLLRLLPPCPETQRQRGWAPPPQRRPRSARPAAPLAGRSGGARLPRAQPCDLRSDTSPMPPQAVCRLPRDPE